MILLEIYFFENIFTSFEKREEKRDAVKWNHIFIVKIISCNSFSVKQLAACR